MPLVTPEENCARLFPYLTPAECSTKQATVGARSIYIMTHCASVFPNDVARNNECRKFCWARTDEASSCTLELTALLNNQHAIEDVQRTHVIAKASMSVVLVAIIAMLAIKRSRSVIGVPLILLPKVPVGFVGNYSVSVGIS